MMAKYKLKYFSIHKNFDKFFIYYLLSLLIFGIFYLHYKHSVLNDSSISEYLINYQGGFVRRGLLGEIIYNFAIYFKLELRFAIFIFQSLFYTIFLFLIYNFFKNIEKNIIIIFSILTPIFLLFPVAEIESLGRKEVVLYIYFLTLININNPKDANSFTLLFLPIVTLIYEEIVLFSGFIFAVLIIKNKINNFFSSFKIILLFVPSALIIIFFLVSPLSIDGHKLMIDALMLNFNETCYMSCNLLISNDITSFNHMLKYIWGGINFNFKIIIFFRYFLIFVIGFFPVFYLSYHSNFKKYNFFYIFNLKNILLLLLVLFIPIIPLFMFGGDWGRWIGMLITFTTIFYFYLYKNNFIEVNYKKIRKELYLFKYKKILVTFFLFLFAFSWNQKTTSVEDVATNPIYKIPYKTIKIIFKIDSLRIFEDSAIIEWHKKYIE